MRIGYLWLLVVGLARTPGTLTQRAISGDDWTRTEHLLALVFDEAHLANWQRTKDGHKGRNRPKPVSPLVQKMRRARAMEEGRLRHYGNNAMSLTDAREYFARFGPKRHD